MENEIDASIKLVFMNDNQNKVLLSILEETERDEYTSNIFPELGEKYVDTYDQFVLYISYDNYNYEPLSISKYFELKSDESFIAAFKEISDIKTFPQFLESFPFNDVDSIVLWMLVLCKADELELDSDELPLLTSLGGTRQVVNNETNNTSGHIPIWDTILFDKNDLACKDRTLENDSCIFEYDVVLTKRSYDELLRSNKYLEFYVKSTKRSNESSEIFRDRYCFLNKVADHLHSPHIKRVFIEETGQMSPRRVNPRIGDFRRDLIENLRGDKVINSCKTELITKLCSSNESGIESYRNYLANFYRDEINQVNDLRDRVVFKFSEIEKLQKELFSKEKIERHLRLLKLLNSTYSISKFWESIYDNTTVPRLKSELDSFGGRDLNRVYEKSLFTDIHKFNSENRFYDDLLSSYFFLKERLLLTLKRRMDLFGDITLESISEIFSSTGLIFDQFSPNNSTSKGISDSFQYNLLQASNFQNLASVVSAYIALDRKYLIDVKVRRDRELQAMVDEIESIEMPQLTYTELPNLKAWGITIKINPPKIPTVNDIARELGGVIDGAGNVIDESGKIVVNIVEEVTRNAENLFQKVGEGLNEMKLFLETELPKLEKYFRKDFGTDLFSVVSNLIIKPINWIFCGGKLPPDNPSEEDGCVEGSIICTETADGTNCTLGDDQGNPSNTPVNSDGIITDEQLQWMRDVELQDLINSTEFQETLDLWMSNAIESQSLQGMLLRNQSRLQERLENTDLDSGESSQLSLEIEIQKNLIELIQAGAGAATQNVIETFIGMINLAQTYEEVRATISFISENGFGAMATAVGEGFVSYWNEFNNSNEVEKSEIIGVVASDVIMSLIPAGTIAKLGKEVIRTAARSSYTRKLAMEISESANRNLGKISGKELGQLMSDLKKYSKTKGNFDFPEGSKSRAEFMKDCWVGPNPIQGTYRNHPGKHTYTSRDGTKIYREPVKKGDGRVKANFEWRRERNGKPIGDGHMVITD